jgi:hypothetical protein
MEKTTVTLEDVKKAAERQRSRATTTGPTGGGTIMAQSSLTHEGSTDKKFMTSQAPRLCALCGNGYARPLTGICGPCHIRFINDSNTGSRREAGKDGAK